MATEVKGEVVTLLADAAMTVGTLVKMSTTAFTVTQATSNASPIVGVVAYPGCTAAGPVPIQISGIARCIGGATLSTVGVLVTATTGGKLAAYTASGTAATTHYIGALLETTADTNECSILIHKGSGYSAS